MKKLALLCSWTASAVSVLRAERYDGPLSLAITNALKFEMLLTQKLRKYPCHAAAQTSIASTGIGPALNSCSSMLLSLLHKTRCSRLNVMTPTSLHGDLSHAGRAKQE